MTAPTREAVAAFLAQFPDADAVADRARALGIKGEPEEPCRCPVALLIEREFSRIVWVESDNVCLAPGECDHLFCDVADATDRDVVLPAPVAEFVRLFDKGVYLDLRAEVTS